MRMARYIVAVTMLVSIPPAVAVWYVIHPLASVWRRVGGGITYLVLAFPVLALSALLFRHRGPLLGTSLGTSAPLLAVAAVAAVAGWRIARLRRRLLTQRILMGFPELSPTDKGRLLTSGIYARIRNPRYVEFVVFVLAYVAFANYVGTWVLFALTFPAIHLVVLLEERELRDRFGAEYEDYCRRVPRYVPRMGNRG